MSNLNVKTFQFSLDDRHLITKDRYETSIEGLVSYEGDVEQDYLLQSVSESVLNYVVNSDLIEVIKLVDVDKTKDIKSQLMSNLKGFSVNVKDFVVKTIDAKSKVSKDVEVLLDGSTKSKNKKKFLGLF
jgi:hypothetical protein